MKISLMLPAQVQRVLIGQDPASISDPAMFYICSIATAIDAIEKQRALDPHSDVLASIRSQKSLFDHKRNEGSILVADLDESSLLPSLFLVLEEEFVPSFWPECANADRPPSDTLCLLSLRYLDSLWQTNLVDEFCDHLGQKP